MFFCLLVGLGVALPAIRSPGDQPGSGAAEILPPDEKPVLRMETDDSRARVPLLSWDTEGGDRAERNLLRSGKAVVLRVRLADGWHWADQLPATRETLGRGATRYVITALPGARLTWDLTAGADRLRIGLGMEGRDPDRVEGVELVFPFDPRVTPTTVLPSHWADDGSVQLPAVVHAPDFGQMLLTDRRGRRLKGRLEGSRSEKTVDLIVELPKLAAGESCTLDLAPVYLPAPEGMRDKALWRAARRGWLGAIIPCARWGDSARPHSAPAGILANNVVSDPASCSLWFYADQMLWTPNITPEISTASLVKRTIDWWLDERTRPTGEVIGYWDYGGFLDANAGPIIAAWDYVEATGDRAWLAKRIERLEFIADFLAARDIDGDGMVEATQSGNLGTLRQPGRSCAWWDALNCGHKDGYTNALIYRAWRCLAEMEGRLGRARQQDRYGGLADRLKAGYAKTLYNPKTGWLAWWKSEDGELHDYATPIVNGLAIEYGLVEPERGRKILARLRDKMRAVGFTRFDLGVPSTLIPVRRGDYLLPSALGLPQREDGTDTFGQYMNGGISAGHALHWMAAHYVVGKEEEGDRILRAMLRRQAAGGFQNGVTDAALRGIDWTDWQGNPTGYEGYLADSFRFLQAVLLREPSFRARYYRPL